MTTCDPILPGVGDANTVTNNKDSLDKSAAAKKNDLDPKIKQTAFLNTVTSQIKGSMIEEVSKNKSIRAKLRTWFVRAHKDNSFVVLKATIQVLDKLTFLTEQHLAEVKFGKALLIVSRKCEDADVKASLEKWVPKAQKSLEIEEELAKAAAKAPPIEDEPKPKKSKVAPSLAPLKAAAEAKKGAKTVVAAKKAEPVAKLNTAFFKKETPAAKVVPTKPGISSVLSGIKVKKRTEAEKAPTPPAVVKTSVLPVEVKKEPAPVKDKPAPIPTQPTASAPAFSALKFVEGLKRGTSPVVNTEAEPEKKKRKQKKRVSWKPDSDLEQVRVFETIEPEDGDGDVANTPHEYGNARDLDRKEGAMLHSGLMHDREEDFLDWRSPRRMNQARILLTASN